MDLSPKVQSTFKYYGFATLAGVVIFLTLSPYRPFHVTTNSIPTGWYIAKKLNEKEQENLKVGDLACFRYTAPSWAEGRYYLKKRTPICKQIAGIEGQWVLINEGNTFVCSEKDSAKTSCLNIGKNLEKDSQGRPLQSFFKEGSYLLMDQELFLWGPTNPKSLDSRYLGPIKRTQMELKLLRK